MTDRILPNLMKTVNPPVQEVQQIPNDLKTFLENPIIQLLKFSDNQPNKRNSLKSSLKS